MPSNSWVPIATALALLVFLLGLVVGTWLMIIGLVLLVITLAGWARFARREFRELPED